MPAVASFVSAIYDGAVYHRRVAPRRHSLRYRLFWMLFDLDELDSLGSSLRLFSRNRFNLFSFRDRDHLDGSGCSLRTQVEAYLEAAGIVAGGPIRLLCVPRILGHAFNPISVYLCHDRAGAIVAVLYEVNNTFGQRHCYLAPTRGEGTIEQAAPKAFYVSPFMEMALDYAFRVEPPAETVSVSVAARDADGPVITTNFTGRRLALSDRAILHAVATHPLMTVKVVAGIHWEAFRLWRKGLPLQPRPPPPATKVTLGEPRP